mgnify:CR=1 FL=1
MRKTDFLVLYSKACTSRISYERAAADFARNSGKTVYKTTAFTCMDGVSLECRVYKHHLAVRGGFRGSRLSANCCATASTVCLVHIRVQAIDGLSMGICLVRVGRV